MQFFAPLWLALGAAAAVPLVLHLWNRRRAGERVFFPAARLLAAATEARGAAIRLREWLLLALRVLAVALLAIAAAQPSVTGRIGARAPGTIALVLDNSLSTTAVVGGHPVLDGLRDELRAALAVTATGDHVALVTADGAVVVGDVATARAALDATHALAGAGDLPGALRRAAALASGAQAGNAAAGAPGAVVLATDGQASSWPRPVTLPRVRVGVVRAPGPAPADRAVVALAAEPARWSPEGVVIGRLSGAGDWHLVLRDSAARVAADVRGSATAADSFGVRVPLRPTARGWVSGTLEVPPDELRGDDVRHVAVRIGAPPRLLADASAGSFAAVAVSTLVEARSASASTAQGETAVRVTEPDAATRLPGVLVAPSDPAHVPIANRALERLGVPWRFAARVDASSSATFRRTPSGAGPPIPVARRWRLDARPTRAPSAVDTLAIVAGDPWIVAGANYVLLASPLDTGWTPFPTRAAFLPWLAAAAARLADPPGLVAQPQTAAPGAPIPVPSDVDGLLGPGGIRSVRGDRIAAPTDPGVYFWLRTGARVGALVVDPEAEEVVLARWNTGELGERIRPASGGDVDVGTSGAAAAAFARGSGGRRSLATLLAAAAVLLLTGEAFAARARAAA